ncbi:MAG: PAS domain S-box protein [Balneolaceae bacterium]
MKHQGITSEAGFKDYMKRQISLLSELSKLDEQSFSIEQLLSTSAELIYSEWVDYNLISVCVDFDGQIFSSPDIKTSSCYSSTEVPVKNEKSLKLILYKQDEEEFSEIEQLLADLIADNIVAKVNRAISHLELQKEQAFLDKAYKLAHIGTWEYDMINQKLHWSAVTKEVHGFEDDYVPDVESTILLFKEGYDRDTFSIAANNAIDNKAPFDIELQIISGKGDERWIRATGEPEFEDGECVRIYGISQNVTGRRKAEEELELHNRRNRAFLQHGMDMIAILNENADYTFASPTCLNVLGLSPEYFIGRNAFEFIHEDDKERIYRQFSNLQRRKSTQLKPFRFLDSKGQWRWLEATITNLMDDSAVQGFVANSRDVTERQIKQEEIIDSLKEKETLLAEIHHRIKNNLSVLTGLLQLQASKENNEEVIERLFDSVARIHTMASIHEQLYQSHNFSSIEFADRIELLALNIQKAFESKKKIKLNFQCESVELSISHALTCSLITNEILTNIFKHAFSEVEKGKITIKLKKINEGLAKMTISDNGKGLPADFDLKASSSLGLTLIHMLAEQLRAEYSFDADKSGTEFNLLFKIA